MICKAIILSAAVSSGLLLAQSEGNANELSATSAEAERKIMEATLAEVLALSGKDTKRGEIYRKAQNEWIKYVKEQAKADADGVSGDAKYPQSYFQTVRELTRYRTRTLEGCLARLQAEQTGVREASVLNKARGTAGGSEQSSTRDWRAEVSAEPATGPIDLFEAELEGVAGVLAGQWRGEELWTGVFLADRGDAIVLYGGKIKRGGMVFEAWQEGTRIGRGFVRDEDGDLRGRFFDDRRRESAIVLKLRKRPAPVSYKVALSQYTGLIGTETLKLGLEWHDTRFARGKYDERLLEGHNYSQGKLFLQEFEGGSSEGVVVAFWSLAKKSQGGKTRWAGLRTAVDGTLKKVDFGR